MTALDALRERIARTLGPGYRDHRWLHELRLDEATAERDRAALAAFAAGTVSFSGSKPHRGALSPGCVHCGEGTWSCLFVNHDCNATCFYCPMARGDAGQVPPSAHGLDFAEPEAYGDFLERFGYRAVGVSGGEPLLAPDRVLSFVNHLRNRFGDSLYLWMYTNGALATEERLRPLAEAGVEEIRFDIAAVNYSLKGLRRARKLFGRVTVEIPAIPEDEERLAALLPVLADEGVDHLHLHQLTVNEHNARDFTGRACTLLHHPEMAVFESELAALRLIARAAEAAPSLPVQYCSRAYKRVYQGRARRFRALEAAGDAWRPTGGITPMGLVRELEADGFPPDRARLADTDRAPLVATRPGIAHESRTLLTPEGLAEHAEAVGPVTLRYLDPVMLPRPAGQPGEIEIVMEGGRQVWLGTRTLFARGALESRDVLRALARAAEGRSPGAALLDAEPTLADEIAPFEAVPRGLATIA